MICLNGESTWGLFFSGAKRFLAWVHSLESKFETLIANSNNQIRRCQVRVCNVDSTDIFRDQIMGINYMNKIIAIYPLCIQVIDKVTFLKGATDSYPIPMYLPLPTNPLLFSDD